MVYRRRRRKLGKRRRTLGRRPRKGAVTRYRKRRRYSRRRPGLSSRRPDQLRRLKIGGRYAGPMLIRNGLLPPVARAVLEWTDVITLSDVGGTVQYGTVSIPMNALGQGYSTTSSAIGGEETTYTSPGGYTQLAASYNRYRVYASKLSFHIINQRTPSNAYQNVGTYATSLATVAADNAAFDALGKGNQDATAGAHVWACFTDGHPVGDASTITPGSYEQFRTLKSSYRNRIIGPGKMTTMTTSWSERSLKSSARDENEAAFGSTPGGEAQLRYTHFSAGAVDDSNNLDLVMTVKMTFFVQASNLALADAGYANQE